MNNKRKLQTMKIMRDGYKCEVQKKNIYKSLIVMKSVIHCTAYSLCSNFSD